VVFEVGVEIVGVAGDLNEDDNEAGDKTEAAADEAEVKGGD
jgi:hypothetical protein